MVFSGKAVMYRREKSKQVTSLSKDAVNRLRKEKLKRDAHKKQCLIYQNNQLELKKSLVVI